MTRCGLVFAALALALAWWLPRGRFARLFRPLTDDQWERLVEVLDEPGGGW